MMGSSTSSCWISYDYTGLVLYPFSIMIVVPLVFSTGTGLLGLSSMVFGLPVVFLFECIAYWVFLCRAVDSVSCMCMGECATWYGFSLWDDLVFLPEVLDLLLVLVHGVQRLACIWLHQPLHCPHHHSMTCMLQHSTQYRTLHRMLSVPVLSSSVAIWAAPWAVPCLSLVGYVSDISRLKNPWDLLCAQFQPLWHHDMFSLRGQLVTHILISENHVGQTHEVAHWSLNQVNFLTMQGMISSPDAGVYDLWWTCHTLYFCACAYSSRWHLGPDNSAQFAGWTRSSTIVGRCIVPDIGLVPPNHMMTVKNSDLDVVLALGMHHSTDQVRWWAVQWGTMLLPEEGGLAGGDV